MELARRKADWRIQKAKAALKEEARALATHDDLCYRHLVCSHILGQADLTA
jgi:hypothetical protein